MKRSSLLCLAMLTSAWTHFARADNVKQLAASYLYTLSKRTDMYISFGSLKNVRASSYAFADASNSYSGVSPGAKSTVWAMGLRHTF